jgi:hypothetical protein
MGHRARGFLFGDGGECLHRFGKEKGMRHCGGAVELRLRRRTAGDRETDLAQPFLIRVHNRLIERRDQRGDEGKSCDPRACHDEPHFNLRRVR